MTKEAKANGNTEAVIIYAYYCDLCDYSTNISGSLKAHKRSKAHLAKEAEVRCNANGNAESPKAMVAQRLLLCANTLATSASIRPTSKGISTAIANPRFT